MHGYKANTSFNQTFKLSNERANILWDWRHINSILQRLRANQNQGPKQFVSLCLIRTPYLMIAHADVRTQGVVDHAHVPFIIALQQTNVHLLSNCHMTCLCVCTYVCVVHMCVYIRVCMYMYMCVCACLHACMGTYVCMCRHVRGATVHWSHGSVWVRYNEGKTKNKNAEGNYNVSGCTSSVIESLPWASCNSCLLSPNSFSTMAEITPIMDLVVEIPETSENPTYYAP